MSRTAVSLALLFLSAPALAQHPTQSWLAPYDGPGNHQDEPFDLALGAGGLFVAGRSFSVAASDDFALLKYTPAGVLAWARHYDGPGHSSDRASAVLEDGAGGAFVCGYSWGGSGWQAALLHYDAAGNLLWEETVATPGVIDHTLGPRLARTPDGRLRMGMTSNGNFLVAAFDGGGAALWTEEIDVVLGDDDFLTGLAVDSSANTIVAGFVGGGFGGYETVMLDADGDVVWTEHEHGVFGNTLGPAFVAVDASGEIVVTGVPESSCGVLQTRTWRLTPGGERLWTRDFPTTFCDTAEAVDMALDRDGNALVLCQATISGEGGWFDFTTLKYDPEGNELWRRSLANPGVDSPSTLEIDRSGNVYVAGEFGLPANAYRGLAASYTPGGSLRWTRIFEGSTRLHLPADIAVGSLGEVYVGGSAFSQATNQDILTVKLQQAPWAIRR